MKTKTALFLIVCLLISLLSGCGTTQNSGGDEIQDNPFDYEGPSEILGSISHRGNWPEREEGKPLEYNGGEIAVPYCAKGDGTGKNVGFLLFIDGIPQPYKLNGEGEYGYMHPFSLKEDNVEEQFTFNFVPVTGKAGDTLTFTVANIFNAGFEPDMINSSNFGLYGSALSTINFIHFSADSETGNQDALLLKALSKVAVTNELMTAQFAEENLGPQIGMTTGDGKTREDKLDESVFMFDTYDGEPELNDLDVTGRDTLHVAVDLCGIPGLTYRVAFFADNAPLSNAENCYWEVTLEKGKVARVEADLELSVLEGVTTFYAIACANDGEDEDTQGLGFFKTGSLPIWSQDKLDASESQSDGNQTESSTPAGKVTDTPDTMDETVRSLWYGQGDTVLVRKSDTLCLVDMTTGKVLAEGLVPDLKNVTYHPVDGGFCAVGETGGSGGTSALMQAGSGETATICVFFDSTLSETDRFSLSALTGEDKHIMCTAISPDGRYAAFSIMNDGIYLYSRGTDKVTLLRDLTRGHRAENSGITMVTGLWFHEDASKLVFADNAHFGSVGLNGKNFVCAGFDSFDPQGAVGYAGGKAFFNENFFTASGAMAVADVDGLTSVIYKHSAREGSGDLYVSHDGGYFATAAFDGSLTVRIYGTEDDRVHLEYTVTDENEDVFNAAPGILILDDLKLCLVKLGGFSDVPARVELLSFE